MRRKKALTAGEDEGEDSWRRRTRRTRESKPVAGQEEDCHRDDDALMVSDEERTQMSLVASPLSVL